jgi:hypothetical protein
MDNTKYDFAYNQTNDSIYKHMFCNSLEFSEDKRIPTKNKLIDFSDVFFDRIREGKVSRNWMVTKYNEDVDDLIANVTIGNGPGYDFNTLGAFYSDIDAHPELYPGSITIMIYGITVTEKIRTVTGEHSFRIICFDGTTFTGGADYHVGSSGTLTQISGGIISGKGDWTHIQFWYCYIHDIDLDIGEDLILSDCYYCVLENIKTGAGGGYGGSPCGTVEISWLTGCVIDQITIRGNGSFNNIARGFYGCIKCEFKDIYVEASYMYTDPSNGAFYSNLYIKMFDIIEYSTFSGTITHEPLAVNGLYMSSNCFNNLRHCVFTDDFVFNIDGAPLGSEHGRAVLSGCEYCTIGGEWFFSNGKDSVLAYDNDNEYWYTVKPASGGGGFEQGQSGYEYGNNNHDTYYHDLIFNGIYHFGAGGYNKPSHSSDDYYDGGAGGYVSNSNSKMDNGKDLYWYSDTNTVAPIPAGAGGGKKYLNTLKSPNGGYLMASYNGYKTIDNWRSKKVLVIMRIRESRYEEFDVSKILTASTSTPESAVAYDATDGYYHAKWYGHLGIDDSEKIKVNVQACTASNSYFVSFKPTMLFTENVWGDQYQISAYVNFGWWPNTKNYDGTWDARTYRAFSLDWELSDNGELSYAIQNPYNSYGYVLIKSTDGLPVNIKGIFNYTFEGVDYSFEKSTVYTPET